jgi:hypothetical protein
MSLVLVREGIVIVHQFPPCKFFALAELTEFIHRLRISNQIRNKRGQM